MTGFKKNSGFLILEVIIYITIILLLSSIVLKINNYSRLTSDAFVKQYVSDIRYVYFKNRFGDVDTALYYLYEDPLNPSKTTGYFINEKGYGRKTVQIPDSLEFVMRSCQYIKFRANGTLVLNGETIELIDKSTNKKYRITIVPISGRVYLYYE